LLRIQLEDATPITSPEAIGENFRQHTSRYAAYFSPFRWNFTNSSADYYRDGSPILHNFTIMKEESYRPIIDRISSCRPYGWLPKVTGSDRGKGAYQGYRRVKRVTSSRLNLLVGDRYWPSHALPHGRCYLALSLQSAGRHKPGRKKSRSMDTCLRLHNLRWLSVIYF